MAHLITSHDPFHIHKILGLLVLIHYIYRFYLLFALGDAFPPSESLWLSTLGVALHGLLSWSSLLLPLPSKRNFKSPMIWPEFRLHSITFALRHVVTTLCTLHGFWPTDNVWLHAMARSTVVLGAVLAASLVTDKLGNREKRTTNAMPYPATVDAVQQVAVKKSYALAQFAATSVCLLSDASLNFAPLLAIQAAPLLMTLVRKGKASSFTYHRVYAISLYLGYLIVIIRLLAGVPKAVGLQTIFLLLFPNSKIRPFLSPVRMWALNIAVAVVVYPHWVLGWTEEHVSDEVATWMLRSVSVIATVRQAIMYAPLFGLTRLQFSFKRKKC